MPTLPTSYTEEPEALILANKAALAVDAAAVIAVHPDADVRKNAAILCVALKNPRKVEHLAALASKTARAEADAAAKAGVGKA
jgi:hypothetical protein